MSLAMKARKTAASRRTSGGGMLIGLFVGLVIGVLVAAGVVWYIHRTPMPFNNKVQAPPPPPPAQTAGRFCWEWVPTSSNAVSRHC